MRICYPPATLPPRGHYVRGRDFIGLLMHRFPAVNRRVVGSSPTRGANYLGALQWMPPARPSSQVLETYSRLRLRDVAPR